MTAQRALKDPRLGLDDFENMLFDRPEDEKWELIDGRLLKSMVGARWQHHVIISNIVFALERHIRETNRPCHVFRETFFLKKAQDDLAALPDIMVRCGPLPPDVNFVDDPLILFEVVSPGSEDRDRFIKRTAYQRLPSLKQYVLVSRDRMLVEDYVRPEESWQGGAFRENPSDILRLPALNFEMTLAEIYRDVIEEGAA